MKMDWLALRAALCIMLTWTCSASAHSDAHATEPLLHPIFQEHAVLQRDAPIRIYGAARPGERLSVTLANHRAIATADADGHWETQLPAMVAGGPHVLQASVEGGASQTVGDVLIGDVWLCSGQSNMVLQVHRSLDSRAEIAGSSNARIRLLSVAETGSVRPLARFATPVRWLPAAPENTANFSAACFYFARELQKTVDVPMGLITAAWGGSRIQAWIGADRLRAVGGYERDLAVLAQFDSDPLAANAAWGQLWQDWWHARPGIARDDSPWSSATTQAKSSKLDSTEDGDWHDAPPELIAWERWGMPALAEFNGMLWYRTRVRLSARQAGQGAVLAIGAADEVDLTWVNGRAVGSSYGADMPRLYPLPAGLLKAGDNLIVVNVLDTYRDGGLVGPANARRIEFADGESVPLDRHWQWRQVPATVGSPPRAPWHTAAGLSTLYNGMIVPVGRYGLRGLVWYQGESNTFEAAQYAQLLPALLADWRTRFEQPDLPMLNVQLANFGPAATQPGESDWAALREVQRRFAAVDPRYGMVTTIDIGDRYDIHPPNKQELGRRLALLARHLVYSDVDATLTGPQALGAWREGKSIVVRLAGFNEALVAYGADGPIGFELCGAEPGSCHYARARIDGDLVRLRSRGFTAATRVRYGWADSPVVTLFDRAGQPAGPFELPIGESPEPSVAQ